LLIASALLLTSCDKWSSSTSDTISSTPVVEPCPDVDTTPKEITVYYKEIHHNENPNCADSVLPIEKFTLHEGDTFERTITIKK